MTFELGRVRLAGLGEDTPHATERPLYSGSIFAGGEGPALQRLEKAVRPSAECRKETVPTEEAGEASKGKITRTGPLRPY